MRLRAIDQIHISSVRAETLRPGDSFELNESAARVLLKAHPGVIEIDDGSVKAERRPLNKALRAPANKGNPKRQPG